MQKVVTAVYGAKLLMQKDDAMKRITIIISKEDYQKAIEHGADSIISDAIHRGYGVYSSKVYKTDDAYFLTYERGDSCD